MAKGCNAGRGKNYHTFKSIFMRQSSNYFLSILQKLVQQGLQVIDTHVHPLEVMNVLSKENYRQEGDNLWQLTTNKQTYTATKNTYTQTDFIAGLKHNSWANKLTRFAFTCLPATVTKTIRNSYSYIGIERLVDEMETCLIQKNVLLAVAPFNTIDEIYALHHSSDRFYYVGSVDVHQINPDAIEKEIIRQINAFNIIGIKLHPNLQGFFPIPAANDKLVEERLRTLYKAAEKYGLYVLLHGGKSNLIQTKYQLSKYPYIQKLAGGKYGIMENYCDEKGRSPLLEEFSCPFVIAHAGCYATNYPDFNRIEKLAKNYPYLLYDTSSINPQHIAKAIRLVGAERFIFGSDALYNKQFQELASTMEGIAKASKSELLEENCVNILSQNFKEKLLSRKVGNVW